MGYALDRIVRDPSFLNGEPCLRLYFPDDPSPERFFPLTDIFSGTHDPSMACLTPKDVALCEAFAATHMPGTELYRRNNRFKRVKILLDENLPYGLVTPLSEQLSNLSHVYLEGLGGFTDEFIYNRPWYCLKEGKTTERKKLQAIKHIIISRDSDLTDLARAQWMQRIETCATPEDIDFGDINTVFRVKDEDMSATANVQYYQMHARAIMRAAYSNEAASYIIGKTGVYPEAGSRLSDLIAVVEKTRRVERAQAGELTLAELESGRAERWDRKMQRACIPA